MVTEVSEMMTIENAAVNGSGMMTVSKMKMHLKMDTTDGKTPENVF
jgi:hypothetical protein